MRPTPPRFCTSLLLRALAKDRGADEIAGDLHEEFAAMAADRGRPRAAAWYALEVVRISSRTIAGRAAGALRSSPPDPHGKNPGDALMRTILIEARHAARTLLKRPALSALVIFTLALGLGANATIFAMIDALLLRPFTIAGVDRLVLLAETAPDTFLDSQETVAPANFFDWKRESESFEHLAAIEWWDVNLAGGDEAERVLGFFVTSDFFATLGVEAALGRTFVPEEETRGNHRRVVLSHDLWQRRFGGDRGLIGKTILLDAEQYEVVGVAPAGFGFPSSSALWAPLAFDAKGAARRDGRYLTVVGKLAPERRLEDAKAEMALIAQRLEQQYPETNKERGVKVLTLVQGMRDQGLGPIVALWQAAAGLVLLIACANVANLLLARGAERQRELAVRSALGATRRRIVREMLVESVVLAAAAVPVALGVAWVGITLVRANLPARLVRFVAGWQRMDVDLRLIAFTGLLALFTAVVFGLLPALRASRPVLAEELKDGARGGSAGHRRQRLRTALVVAEIALALPLLVASGLTTLGAYRFLNGPQGYEPAGLLAMRAVLPDAKYLEPESRRRFVEDLRRQLTGLPGVRSAAVSNVLPATGNNSSRAIEVEGTPITDKANAPRVDFRAVAPGYFQTMHVPIVQGRDFTNADTESSQPVVIISKATADRHFRGSDPIGRRLRLGDETWLTVVGVSGDVIQDWFSRRNAPTVFRPYRQAPTSYLAIALRADGDLASLIPAVRGAFRAVDVAQPVFDVMPMQDALQERTIGLQYVAAIMAIFGMLALVLAVVGVYSLMAFVVAQRTQEIGIRIALGASQRDVLRLTIGQAAYMTAIGITVGLALSFGLGRVLQSVLFGVISPDARISALFAAVLVAAAITAGYVPARKATRIDPIIALRQ